MKKNLLTAGLIIALTACGCSKSQKTDTAADQSTENAVSESTEKLPGSACQAAFESEMDMAAWTDANNSFAIDMLHEMPADKNTVFSPFSIERTMGMVLEGACGATASELRSALKLPEANHHSTAGHLVEQKLLAAQNDSQVLDIDNHLWVQDSYALLENYMNQMQSDYQAAPTSLDFIGSADSSRKTINEYISKATHEKINDILPEGSISSLTRLVLTNAVYFKAPWQHSFNPESTQKADFITPTGTIQVDMMRQSKSHRAYVSESLSAVDLDFENSPFSFMVILPRVGEDGDVTAALDRVEKTLSAAELRQIREQMSSQPVVLQMPKFKLEAGSSIRSLLEKFGVHLAFSHADFSGMSGVPDLYLSDVFHKAFIEVDEQGAEAAAATAAVMMKRSMPAPPLPITVDHPFLFSIIERETGTILFLGRMTSI